MGLAAVPHGAQRAAADVNGVDVAPASTLLRLNRVTLDTAAATPAVAPALSAGLAPTSWVVQLRSASTPDQVDALRAVGLRVVAHGYVPDNGWLVRGQADAADRARQLAIVQAVIPFHPAYRISPRLDGLVGLTDVRVLLFDDANLPAWASKITALGATELGRVDDADVKLLHLRLDTALVPGIARLDAVQWIEPAPPLKL